MMITDKHLKDNWKNPNLMWRIIKDATRFGVEIECFNKDYYSDYDGTAPPSWVLKRLKVPPRWEVSGDGSVPFSGTELISPAWTRYIDGARDLRAICQSLDENNWHTKHSQVGGHTNIESLNLDNNIIIDTFNELESKRHRYNFPGARPFSCEWAREGADYSGYFGLRLTSLDRTRGMYSFDYRSSNNRLEFRFWEGSKDWKQWVSQIAYGQWFLNLVRLKDSGEDYEKYIQL